MSDARTAQVRVPASTSNLGAGFDCIGFAVDRWLSATAVAHDSPVLEGIQELTLRREGTLAPLTLPARDDALVTGFAAACASRGRGLPARLELRVHSEIPVSRGLGSSSAALIAGASLANETLELGLDRNALAQLCAAIEGHPDNVGPALFGGAVMGVPTAGVESAPEWVFAPIAVHPDLAFAFVVPPFLVETATARSVLPREIPHRVAVRATGKSAALAHGLVTGDAALLRIALDDVLHVPFRRHLIPGFDDVVRAALEAGAYGATLSGSGSTLLAVATQDVIESVAATMRRRWSELGVETESIVQRRAVTV